MYRLVCYRSERKRSRSEVERAAVDSIIHYTLIYLFEPIANGGLHNVNESKSIPRNHLAKLED